MIYRGAALGLLLFGSLISQLAAQPAEGRGAAEEPPGRRVYVPVEDLDVVLEHDKQGVILPRAEFLKLWSAAREFEDQPQSPYKLVVSRGQYAARIDGDQLVVSATIEFNQLARGWQTATLPFTGFAVEGATLDGKPAQVGRGPGDGRPLIVFSHEAGRHLLKLELSTALVSVGSDKLASFGLAPIASATLQLSLPAGKFLHLDEIPLDRPAAADQPAAYTVALGGRSGVTLRITDRKTHQDASSLVFAATAIGLHVAPEERTWRAVTSLSVFGKPIDNLTFVVPKALEIVGIESTGLERWEIGDGPGGMTTTLKLVYRQPFNDARIVTFSGVSASVIGQTWSVPTLLLPGATSHLVRVLVQHPAGLRLQQVEAVAVRRISNDETAPPDMPGTGDMPMPLGAEQALHYAAWREDFSLSFVTQPRARELQATIATRIDISSQELTLRSSVAIQSRFAPLFDFDLALPVDWIVTDVTVENRPAVWRVVPVAAGSNQVRVSFSPPIPADGKVNLTLTARMIPGENWPIEETPLSFKLPEVTLPQVGVTDGRYMIAADDDLELVPEELSGLDPVRLTAAEQSAPNAPRLTYEYQDTHFAGTLKVVRKPVRVAAQTLAYHRLDRETLISHLEGRMVVQGGGLMKLLVALPESAGTNLRFLLIDPPGATAERRPQITEQTSAAPANGERIWTLQLDQRVFGLVWLAVDLTAPRSADAKTTALPGLRVVAADRQNGFVAIEGGPDQQLDVAAIDAAGQPLVEVDPADVPVPLGYVPKERIVAAYRAARPGFRVSLTETRYDRQAVPTAVCDKATLTSVLGDSGQQQHQAVFALRSVGVQSLRVELPASASLWATLVDGRPIEVRVLEATKSGGSAWIVPLPQGGDPSQPHAIQFFYRTAGESLKNAGTLREVPPRIAAISGQGETQPIEILDRQWVIYHPDKTEITASTGQFETAAKPSRDSLLGRLHSRLTLAAPENLWQKGVLAAIVAAVIGVFFFAWRRRGLIIACLAIVGLGVVTVPFLLPSVQQAKLAPTEIAATDSRFNSGAGIDNYWQEERYGKVPVRDPVEPTAAPASAPASPKLYPRSAAGAESAPTDQPGAEELAREKKAVGAKEEMLGMDSKSESRERPASRMRAKDSPEDRRGDAAISNLLTINKKLADTESKRSGAADQKAAKARTLAGARRDESGKFYDRVGTDFNFNLQSDKAGAPQSADGAKPANGLPNTFGQPLPPFGSGTDFTAPADVLFADGAVQAGTQFGSFNPQAAGTAFTGKGALLSLAINIPVLPNSRATEFHYTGAPAPGSEPTLEVEYQNRRMISFVSLAWQAGVLVLFWFARKWSGGSRSTLAVAGLLGPLALVSLVPVDVLPYLDGIFLGTIWGLLLWLGIAVFVHPREVAAVLKTRVHLAIAGAPVFIACGLASTAQAQETKSQAPAAAAAAPEASHIPGTTIVIPYETENDPLQAGRVFLPWERFLSLWNAAHPEQMIEPAAPVEGLVAEALYAVQPIPAAAGKQSLATVTARFVLHSFRDEQITLALPMGRVALDLAQLDGKSAALVTRDAEGGPELAVVVSTPGVHVLDVKYSAPWEQTGAAGKFTLATRPVAAGSLRLTLPAADLNLRVSGGAKTFRRVREQNQTIAIVPLDQGGDITLAWTPAQVREAAQGIVHVESTAAIALGDSGLRISSSFKYTVRQGAISDLVFSLPPGVLVRQIAGLDLGGWEIAGEGAERTLKVFLRRPVNDTTLMQLDLFAPQAFTEQALPVTVPQVAPQSVTRETGTVGIFAEGQLTVTAGAVAGLAQIDLGLFVAPVPLAAPGAAQAKPVATVPQLAYRFAARPVNLQLLVARQKPQSKGIAEHAVFVGARKMRIASRFDLRLAGAPRSEVIVQLPIGYLLYDLKANDSVDYHVESRGGDANPLLIVELSAPRTGVIELVLDGIIARAPEDVAAQVTLPAPLEIGELKTSLAVWLDGIYTATVDESKGWKAVDPGELVERLRAAYHAPVQFGFTSSAAPLTPVGLTLQRATPRLTADGLSLVIARDTSVQHVLYLRWNIAAAGESRFVFTTPDWLADRLEFDRTTGGGRIRQVLSEKIPGNRLRWTLILDDPRTSVATLVAQATLPPPEGGRIAAPTVIFEQQLTGEGAAQYQPLEQQHQYVVLVNQSPQRLSQESPDAVEAIPAVDLPIKISQTISDQAAEILKVRNRQSAIGWKLLGGQQLKGLSASVNLAKMTLVVARDGSWRGEAQYRINNRARQFLALRMPAGARILSLFVAGRPSRPIDPKRPGEPNLVLVPLPKTAAGDLAVEIKLIFAGRFSQSLPKGMQIFRSELDLPVPQVLSQTEDPNFGIPVAATEWTVVLPPDIDVKPIENSDRTNMTQSEAGGEEAIAEVAEALNLYQLALDESQEVAVKSRAMNNLKRLKNAQVLDTSNSMAVNANANPDTRQAREYFELQGKLQQAQQQLQLKESERLSKQIKQQMADTGVTIDSNSGYLNAPSAKDLQRELIVSNTIDFSADSKAQESDKLNFTLQQPAVAEPQSAKPASKMPSKSGKQQGANRSELRQQTAEQSLQLNTAVNPAPNQPQDFSRPQLGNQGLNPQAANNFDADQLLDLSNAEVTNQFRSNSERRSKFRKSGGAEGGQAIPNVSFGAMGSQPATRGGGMGGMGGGIAQPAEGVNGPGQHSFAATRGVGGGGGAAALGRNESGEGVDSLAVDDLQGGDALAVAWTGAGGLSLDMNLPQEGQKLTFSKSGGDGRLALGLRPRASLEVGFGLAWTVVWLLVALGLIAALGRTDALAAILHRLPLIAVGLGLAWFFLLPLAPLGFLLFALGAVGFGWQHRRA